MVIINSYGGSFETKYLKLFLIQCGKNGTTKHLITEKYPDGGTRVRIEIW